MASGYSDISMNACVTPENRIYEVVQGKSKVYHTNHWKQWRHIQGLDTEFSYVPHVRQHMSPAGHVSKKTEETDGHYQVIRTP
jgi:hypothetical protein